MPDIEIRLVTDEERVETPEQREARLIQHGQDFPLRPEWCSGKGGTCTQCGLESDAGQEFRCYPGDGECRCGLNKHHVHGQCGRVTQVG